MINLTQLDTFGAGHLRVQPNHVDRVTHFVGHTLARWLHLRPKFEIVWFVIGAVAILMMDVFVLSERPTQQALHDNSVLVQFDAAALVDAPVSRRHEVTRFRNGAPLPSFVPAVARTEALLPVVAHFNTFLGAETASLAANPAVFTLEHNWFGAVHIGQYTLFDTSVKELI